MVIQTTNPFEGLLKLQQALSNMATRDSWFTNSISSRGGFPPINIFQQEDNYVIVAEIPGIKRDEVSIEIQRNRVRLSGEKTIDYGKQASLHRRERQAGKFDRTFTTPFEIDSEKARAEYRDGVLALFLPRAEHEKPRTIKIS